MKHIVSDLKNNRRRPSSPSLFRHKIPVEEGKQREKSMAALQYLETEKRGL
ncbi:hypothetical protein F511_19685 [Dorcoceras hygrometricum]|uniref:Uncharacterized protein n=1 Tax=Dorcoceras hygrometricum TaxID=472368 RepID=A0A2Z7AKW9_9LAMI|nr:hypothetical protein F511_19685 [Dorcoceras hygrometricum]